MSTSQPIDVRDMAIVHRTFRSAYEESAQLVRAATTDEVSHEHQVVQTALSSALAAYATWRHHPTVETGEALAATLEPLDEDDRDYMKRNLPGPVRLHYPLMIQRLWTKYASMLRSGT